jgi:tetratricopeptide (TPR) repeat protein
MALAEHAKLGGDLPRAVQFYARAAEQSLERNDLTEAIARAARGVACGASGEALGLLKACSLLASYGLAKWEDAAEAGPSTLDLLPPGSLWWCRVAEKLFNVLPTTGRLDLFHELVERFATIEPATEAVSAYIAAAGFLVAVFGVMGVRPAATRWLGLIDKVSASLPEHDAYARGVIALGRAWTLRTLDPEPFAALSVAEESAQAFTLARHPPGLCLAKSLLGTCRADLGDLAGAEEALRGALALAREIRDAHAIADAQVCLGLALMNWPDQGRVEEMERLARAALEVDVGLAYSGAARGVIAAAHLARGELEQAEAEARRSYDVLVNVAPPCALLFGAVLMRVLKGQGRLAEAAATMAEALDRIDGLGGTGATEVPVCVAAAEAFHAAGDVERARAVLRRAIDGIELRAGKIPDPAQKQRYLTGRPENVRAIELSRAWLAA